MKKTQKINTKLVMLRILCILMLLKKKDSRKNTKKIEQLIERIDTPKFSEISKFFTYRLRKYREIKGLYIKRFYVARYKN